MCTDRFILSPSQRASHFSGFCGPQSSLEDDPQVTKLYRMLVLNECRKPN
jgi:hypothetical protein